MSYRSGPLTDPAPDLRQPTFERFVFWAGILSALLSLAAPFFYVNIPCRDDWELVRPVGLMLDGHFQWSFLWTPHEEHRLFLTRLILCPLAAWTSWDMRLIPWLDLALIILATFALASLSGKRFFWAAALFTLSLPSLKTVNWLMNLNTYLSAAAAVLSISVVAADPRSNRRWGIAVFLALVATFSFGTGLALWFAMVPMLFARGRFDKKAFTIWVLAGASCLWLYFHGLRHVSPAPFFGSMKDCVVAALFFLVYLGALFHPLPAEAFGTAGILCFLYFGHKIYRDRHEPDAAQTGLFCVMLFVVGNAFLVALKRSHFGVQYALAERYLALSAYFWAAMALIVSRRWVPAVPWRPFWMVCVGSILLIAPLHWMNFQDTRDFMLQASRTIQEEAPDPRALIELYEVPGVVQEAIPVLRAKRLSIFRAAN